MDKFLRFKIPFDLTTFNSAKSSLQRTYETTLEGGTF